MSISKTKARAETRTVICSAIKSRRIIEFYYHGGERMVEPFCLGLVMYGDAVNESLLCYQIGGYCEYGESVGWKLYRVSELLDLSISSEHFTEDRPGYDPDNMEMKIIYCCVSLGRHNMIEPGKPEESLIPIGVRATAPVTNTDVDPGLKNLKGLYAPSDIGAMEPIANKDINAGKKKSRRLFTRSYIRMIKLSRKLNRNKNISGDVYFHPTEGKVIVKSIDLSLPNTLCEINSRPRTKLNEKNRQYFEKRWLEAYLINQAKHNNWKIRFQKNEYSYLLSQLEFRRDISKGEKRGKVLDLLLYNDEKNSLVVLEVESQANITVLNKSKIELADLVAKLKESIDLGEIAEAFGVKDIKGIFAYLVCPKNDIEHDLGKYGLIEFDRIENPWKQYKESGKDLEIKFSSRRGAFNLL